MSRRLNPINTLGALLGLVGLLAALLLTAAPASAAELTHLESLGGATPVTLGTPSGLAVDQSSHQVYVIDSAAATVSRWNADGTPADFSALGSTNVINGQGAGDATPQGGLNFGAPNEVQLAIDESGGATDGDIYVTQSGSQLVDIFSSAGAYLGQLTEYKAGPAAAGAVQHLVEPCGVAVASDGHVYISDWSSGIHLFAPSGQPATNANSSSNFEAQTGTCTLAMGAGATAGSFFKTYFSGALFKADAATGSADYNISPVNQTVTVNPLDGHVFAATSSGIDEWDASGPTSATKVTSTPLASAGGGVAVDGASGRVYVTRAGDTHVEIYGSGATQWPLTINKTGTGSGTVAVECKNGASYEPCTSPIADETEVKVTATSDPDSEPPTVSGTGSAAGCSASPCEFKITEGSAVNAEFNLRPLAEFAVDATVNGNGEMTGTTIACTGAGGACTEDRKETETVTLQAQADVGWQVSEWTGVSCDGGNTSTTCTFEMPAEAVAVAVTFAESASASPLTVFVTGQGSVSATPGPIAGCTESGGVCGGSYSGTVTLTETPGSGSVFAGWIGCQHKSATECEVTVSAAKEVYAVFLKEGTAGAPGSPGEPGASVTIGTATTAECPNGGITVEVTGSPASKKAICNGASGSNGATGPTGAPGAQGSAGADGATGAPGERGAAGAQGPAGLTGPQGPAGPAGKVTCKVQQKKGGKKVKVTCTVKYAGGASASSASWRLSHAGHVVRRGHARKADGSIDLGSLNRGRYRLHVDGQRHGRLIVVG